MRKLILCLILSMATGAHASARRLVVLKVDGLPGQLLSDFVKERDPATGLSRLPWIEKVFFKDGAWVKNFYSRGVSVSAPSWQVIETGQHLVIHGNVEYDRYTMKAYDYLNFFPFYFKYSRSRSVDMPTVETMDRVGIPLLIDRFSPAERYQGIQLFQRELRWSTVESTLHKRFTTRSPRQLFNEWQSGFNLRNIVNEQVERELLARLQDPNILYLDYFTPEFDHLEHLDNSRESRYASLKELDGLVGRIQSGIERSPLAGETLFVMISDHGMNSSPDFFSQGFDLVKFFGSAAGGGHHVVTNRHPMEAFKVKGLNPFVSAVVTPASDSSYLDGQQSSYPTVLLDLDGNERASIYLRSNSFNQIHILLQQLQRKDLAANERERIAILIQKQIEDKRKSWRTIADELDRELEALTLAIANTQREYASYQNKEDPKVRRLKIRVEDWRSALTEYGRYRQNLLNLLSLDARQLQPGRFRIVDYILPRAMGDTNTIHDLQNYVTAYDGQSFRTMNYFAVIGSIRIRNNVQERVGNRPVDFTAVRVPPQALEDMFPGEIEGSVWLYGDESHQALILRSGNGLRYLPIAGLTQEAGGRIHFKNMPWGPGYPLQIWEDGALDVPEDHTAWLNRWHTETEWLYATHGTRYTNAVSSLGEFFARRPPPDDDLVARFEHRRRENTDADILVMATDGWNFNVRGFNPGGNHGSFFAPSTLSTLLLSGAGIAPGLVVETPYDGLSVAPTLLRILNRPDNGLPGPFIKELF